MIAAPAWQTLVYLVAVADALMLAGALLFTERLAATRARPLLSLFLVEVAVLLALFAVLEPGWLAATAPVLALERFLALLLPCTALHYVRLSMGQRSTPAWIYLPPALFLVNLTVFGRVGLVYVDLGLLITTQIIYTVAATAFLWQARREMAVWPVHLAWLVGGLWMLHVAQVARLSWPDQGWLFDAVPLVGAAFLLGLTWRVLVDPRALRRLAESGDAGPASRRLEQLDAFMAREKPYLDPGLDLATLAAGLDVSPRALSAHLKRHPAGGFYGFVNQHRIAAARQILRDPKERRTSVEAVALMVGFRSRSTFYTAFGKEVGMTPTAYRNSATD